MPTCRRATSRTPTRSPPGSTNACRSCATRWPTPTSSRVADEQTRSFLEKRNGHLRGSLVDRMDLDAVAGDTALRRRPGKPCVLRPDGDRLHLLLGDRRMTVPARITDAVERVRTLAVFTPDDLGLDTESGLVLCRRLIREGLLEVVR